MDLFRESFEGAISARDFHRPVVAQLWFEWRRTVHLLFVSLLCGAGVLAFVVLSPLVNETWGGVHAVRMWIGAIVFIPFVYQLLATDPVVGLTHKQGATRLSLFDATRPLRCDQMIAIKLLVVAGWSIFGFLLMVVIASMHTTLTQQWSLWGTVIEEILTGLARVLTGEVKPVAESIVPELPIDWPSLASRWWLAGLCVFAGLYFSTTAMCLTFVMAICKYPKVFTTVVLFATASLGVWAWDDSHGRTLRWLWLAYGYLIPTVLIVGMLIILGVSLTAGYLSNRYLMGVLCWWGVYVGTVIILVLKALSLFPLVYDELKALARKRVAREKTGHSLNATALVHEAYVRLVGNDGGPSLVAM